MLIIAIFLLLFGIASIIGGFSLLIGTVRDMELRGYREQARDVRLN